MTARAAGEPVLRGGLAAGSLASFVVLGLPQGMLGVAWPVLRHQFGQPLASLGELLLVSLAGYLLVTGTAGWLQSRWGTGRVLAVSVAMGTAGAGLFAYSRWWLVLVAASLLSGAAGGGLDAGLNTAVAMARQPRFMNLLHASFGAGAALGPLIVTASLAVTSSWRAAYVVLLAAQAALTVFWVLCRSAFPPLPRAAAAGPQSRREAGAGTSAQPRPGGARHAGLLLLGLAVFSCYGGVEIAAGSWLPSFLRGPGAMSQTAAGVTVFLYWAGLTGGRLGAAALGDRVSPAGVIWAGVSGSVVGTALVWANPSPALLVTAVALTGLSLGPIFPALVNLTPGRLGPAAAVHAVGWQLAAGAGGGSGLSALIGVVLQVSGLAMLGPILVLFAAALGAGNLLLERGARSRTAG